MVGERSNFNISHDEVFCTQQFSFQTRSSENHFDAETFSANHGPVPDNGDD